MSIKVYTSKNCGWAIRNYAALHEKNIDFEVVAAKDNKGTFLQDFYNSTPMRQTPVLIDDGVSVFDSLLINEYIEDKFGGISLMPEKAEEKAVARCVMHYCDQVLIKKLAEYFGKSDYISGRLEEIKMLMEEFYVRYIKGNSGPYFFGDQFTLVDIAFYNYFSVEAYLLEMGMIPSDIPSRAISKWKEHILNRPSILKAIKTRDGIDF